ncbi:MAG: hypothetical protein KAS62_11575 [Candidatus Delongbacteria bacterium]|nr:hypothetical protein [Candidatus Delongbacteria bacterium]
MKIFLKSYKFLFESIPSVVRNFLILFAVSVTIYRIYFLPSEVHLFLMEGITITRIIFRIIFTMFVIGAYSVLFGLLSISVQTPVFRMIPNMGKKVLVFVYVNFLLLYLWSVAVIGFSDPTVIRFYTMLNLWFISSIISFGSGLQTVYRSEKYKIAKVIFFIFSIAIPIFSVVIPVNRPLLYCLIVGGYILIVLYQIVNFTSYFIEFKPKREKRDLEKTLESWQDLLDRLYEWKFGKLKKELLDKPSKGRINKLVSFTMFGNEFFWMWIEIGIFLGFTYAVNIYEMDADTFFIGVNLYNIVFCSIIITRLFKQKYKIEFLYTALRLKRDQFEKQILKSTIVAFRNRMFKVLFPTVLMVIVCNFLFSEADLNILIVTILTVVPIQLILIYYFWNKKIRNREYSSLGQTIFIQRTK